MFRSIINFTLKNVKHLIIERPFRFKIICITKIDWCQDYPRIDNLNNTLKAFDDIKNKQKSVWSNVFWYVKVCIFWKCIQYTIDWDKTQIFKKNFFGQNRRYKKCSLFSFASFISSQFYFCDYYLSWSTRFVPLKLCVGFSTFDSVSFLLKFIFLFNKMHGFFDFKTS